MTAPEIDRRARREILRRALPYYGKAVPASFIQKTGEVIRGLDRLHNLIEGIYKPAGSAYALSIASMLKNPYADRLDYNRDRSWFFHYSPKDGSLDSAVNAALFNCMRDKEPVIVFKQLSNKSGPHGTRYRILGLGLLEVFDEGNRLFRIRGMHIEEINSYLGLGTVMEENLIDTAIQLESLEDWRPFEDSKRSLYKVNLERRNQAFRKIVLGNYESTCCVTGQRFQLRELTEAQAAHIISKEDKGTDDPRNGLAMSRTVHWAFDEGLFTITDQYEVEIHPKARDARILHFPLFEKDRQSIQLPNEDYFYPHQEALTWHRKERFGRFLKTEALGS